MSTINDQELWEEKFEQEHGDFCEYDKAATELKLRAMYLLAALVDNVNALITDNG